MGRAKKEMRGGFTRRVAVHAENKSAEKISDRRRAMRCVVYRQCATGAPCQGHEEGEGARHLGNVFGGLAWNSQARTRGKHSKFKGAIKH